LCGIVSYYGKKDSVPFLINGLRRLEYRGYDSAGIALMKDGIITSIKKAGKIDELDKKIKESPVNGSIGIAHTRWATHGEPNESNH
jgi:glucosamine--fructose-6-phosphate aminotransferase (isomerizing)